jgi:hypothetical protein
MKNKVKKTTNGYVSICDSKRTVDGKSKSAYRVKSIGANGEVLQVSEVLNTKKAVITHLRAMRKLYAFDLMNESTLIIMPPCVSDETKKKSFKAINSFLGR